jgi:transcriptional regulator with XRE-family HTH domain
MLKDYEEIAENIKALRKDENMTQKDVAKLMNNDVNTYAAREKNTSKITLGEINKLIEIYGEEKVFKAFFKIKNLTDSKVSVVNIIFKGD